MMKIANLIRLWIIVAMMLPTLASCSDDKDTAVTGLLTFADDQSREIDIDSKESTASLSFTARMVWKAVKKTNASWLTLSEESGTGGKQTITFTATLNNSDEERTEIVILSCGEQSEEFTIVQSKSELVILSPSDIPDYDKFFHNSEHGGDKILRSDAKFSFTRFKQSEHFFVFWDKYFGDDPNGEHVAQDERVDVDDLLAKAEQFFQTNIEKLGMAVLGQGKSYLDKYKMQIYILDPTPEWWVATGSGYDNTIGALWITPSTCQPVGSTIAHEIGHSFQYQVYCDKLLQGEPDDSKHGFRYGYPNSNGGCGFWEQCAQWQSYQDYPEEQFTTYNFDVWLSNYNRHFEHEWMRYASYWLQSYWVDKHGIESLGRIWRESVYPNDAIDTYTNIYNGGDYAVTREELFDYAVRMATFDIKCLPSIKENYQGKYTTNLLKNNEGFYQPTYASCPGATGFNVITLKVPSGGGEVSVNFRGLALGASLLSEDAGEVVDGDGNSTGKTVTTYNKLGTEADMGWRYGFVAYANGTRTYSSVGKDRTGTLTFNVPSNAEALYLVVQGSPETYKQCPWDEDGTTDYQYPYAIKITGTTINGLTEYDIDTTASPTDVTLSYSISVGTDASYEYNKLNITTEYALCQAFVMQPASLKSLFAGVTTPAEGKITMQLLLPDGTTTTTDNCGPGFWCGADGTLQNWGTEKAFAYVKPNSLDAVEIGFMPGSLTSGQSGTLKPQLVYTKNGKQYVATININLSVK